MGKNYKYFLLAPLEFLSKFFIAGNNRSLILTGLGGLSGLILALGYPGWSFDLGFLVWFGFTPLFYALSSIGLGTTEKKYKKLFGVSAFAGFVYFLIVFRWFWSFYPLDTLGIRSGLVSFVIILSIYLAAVAAMAAFLGLFGLAFSSFQFLVSRKVGSKLLAISHFLAVPAIFVLLEYARAYGYGLLWFGSGALVGPHWTMGNPAYSLAGNPAILKLSSYVGVYGVAFLIIAANFLIFLALEKWGNGKSKKGAVVAAVLLLGLFGSKFLYGGKPADVGAAEKKIKFALVQTKKQTKIFPTPKESLNAFKEQLELLNKVAKEHPESQLIIFPEASDFFKNMANLLSSAQVQTYFTKLFKDSRLIISGSRVVDSADNAYSRVFSLDTEKDIIDYYDKRLLTPGGEFLPYPIRFITNLISKTKVSQFGALREFKPGNKKISTVNFWGQFKVAPIICSELLSPGLTRLTTSGSDLMTGMASYGIFHGKSVFIRQNLAGVRFRAAENNMPVIMAANMGDSYAVDNLGNVRLMAKNQEPQILTGEIAIGMKKSWYNKVGDLPIFLVSLLLMICFGLLTRFRK